MYCGPNELILTVSYGVDQRISFSNGICNFVSNFHNKKLTMVTYPMLPLFLLFYSFWLITCHIYFLSRLQRTQGTVENPSERIPTAYS